MKVTDDWVLRLRLGIIALEERTPEAITMRGLERDDVDFSQDQRFGPLTPWVVANARAMLALEELDIVVARMEEVAMAMDPDLNETALAMLATTFDRTGAIVRIRQMSMQLGRRLAARCSWKELAKDRADEIGRSRAWTWGYLNELLVDFIANTLAACAMQDVMSDDLTMSATGAWRSMLSPHEDFPGDMWRCTEATAQLLRDFFADLDEDGLVDRAVAIEDPRDTEESRQCLVLIGSTLVRAASPPRLAEIVGPGLCDLLKYRGARSMMDQLARLIAGLADPPDSIESADIARLRHTMTEALGVQW